MKAASLVWAGVVEKSEQSEQSGVSSDSNWAGVVGIILVVGSSMVAVV